MRLTAKVSRQGAHDHVTVWADSKAIGHLTVSAGDGPELATQLLWSEPVGPLEQNPHRCSDGNCVLLMPGAPVGAHTNGGCKCLRDPKGYDNVRVRKGIAWLAAQGPSGQAREQAAVRSTPAASRPRDWTPKKRRKRTTWGQRLRAELSALGLQTTADTENTEWLAVFAKEWSVELRRTQDRVYAAEGPDGDTVEQRGFMDVTFRPRGWPGQHERIKGGRGVNRRAARLIAEWHAGLTEQPTPGRRRGLRERR